MPGGWLGMGFLNHQTVSYYRNEFNKRTGFVNYRTGRTGYHKNASIVQFIIHLERQTIF